MSRVFIFHIVPHMHIIYTLFYKQPASVLPSHSEGEISSQIATWRHNWYIELTDMDHNKWYHLEYGDFHAISSEFWRLFNFNKYILKCSVIVFASGAKAVLAKWTAGRVVLKNDLYISHFEDALSSRTVKCYEHIKTANTFCVNTHLCDTLV